MAVTIDGDFLAPPDDNTGLDAGAGDGRDLGSDVGGVPVDTSTPVGAAAVDLAGNDTNQNKTGYGDLLPGMNTEPVGGGAPVSLNNMPEPSIAAANQGVAGFDNQGGSGVGFARNLANPEGLRTPGVDYTGGGGGLPGNRGTPQGTHELLAAGPGYEIGGGYGGGMMFNDNMPMSTKINEGWQPGGYIGPNTIVPNGNGAMDYGAFGLGAPEYGKTRFGTYGNGVDANGRPIDIAGFGTQGSAGGAPFGPGINMGYAGATNAQGTYNATLGMAPLGGGGLPGNRTGQDTLLGTTPGITGGLPGNRGTGMTLAEAAAQLPAQYQNDPWAQRFEQQMGFFDPRYDSKQAFLHNAENTDQVIRGAGIPGGTGQDQLAVMAQYDPNARAVLDAIQGTPRFYESQQAANQAGLHNQEINNRLAAGAFAGNKAAEANLLGQRYSASPNPGNNFDTLLAPDVHAQVQDLLKGMGASNVKIQDGVLSWDSASGNPHSLPFNIADSSALIKALQGDPDARAYIASQNQRTGGGYAPRGGGRSSAPRGGGGGGNQPAAQEPAPSDFANTLFNGYGNYGEGAIPGAMAQPTYRGNVVDTNSPLGRKFVAF